MAAVLRKILKYLAYAAAAGVMLLALLVGIARLLLPLVPDYQDDIRAWAAAATGFEVRFEHISASWPIAGPEIQFLEVTIGSPEDHQPIFVADRLDIGISVMRLIRDQELTVARVGVQNTRLAVQRGADGEFSIQGRPLEDFLPERDQDQPLQLPEIDIELRDVGIAYRDVTRGEATPQFRIARLDLRLGDTRIEFEGDVELDPEFGELVTVSADMPAVVIEQGIASAEGQAWSVYATGERLNVARILEYALDMPTPVASGGGNLVLWTEFSGASPTGVTAEFDLNDVELDNGTDELDLFQAIRGRVEWERQGGGWVLAGSDLDLRTQGFFSPGSDFSISSMPGDTEGATHWEANVGFLRLHDWFPVLRAFASEPVRDQLLPADISGDVSDIRVDIRLAPDADPQFAVELGFEGLGIAGPQDGEGIAGLTGTVVADHLGGRLQIDSDETSLTWPTLFTAPLEVERIEGFFVWRVTPDGVRVLSDNVQVRTSFARANSRFQMDLPRNGESPYLDLTATAEADSAPPVVGFLPLRRFPPQVREWLQRAIVAGRATGADIEVRGPMREFPFDHEEGVFRIGVDVVDGELDYAAGWPAVKNIESRLVFDGVGLYTRRNRASYGGITVVDADVAIPDLRQGQLTIGGRQTADLDEALAFLRASPIADAVGPTLNRVSGSGQLSADVSLRLPIKRLRDWQLQLDISTDDARLELERLNFDLQRIAGSVTVRNTKFYADGLSAELLGEPVSITMRPAEPGGLRSQFATIEGRTPVRSWIDAFQLPQAERFSGTTDWQALVMFPARQEDESTPPLHILVRSDLAGVESLMPAPVAKAADEPRPLRLDAVIPSEGQLQVNGRLADDLSWALQFEEQDGVWRVERAGVHAGSAAALLPLQPGVELTGHVDFVRVDDWIELADGEADAAWQELYNSADLRADRLSMFGQAFPDVSVDAHREDRTWHIRVDGPNLAGELRLPLSPDNDTPAVLDLERLWLLESDPGDRGEADPRSVIPVSVTADEFALASMRFGSLAADLRSTPSGVVIDPIDMQGETYSITGDAAWLVHPNDDSLQQSRLQLQLSGSDIKNALTSFGYDPVIEGESVTATADLTWDGAPDSEFLYRAVGSFNVDMRKGALLSLEPGGGRLLGVLSVTALPRRLALDFRDVTDEGLGFDSLRGDFTVDGGNVYTCNLGLEGSVADMGIVGRTGLTTEDYDQLAVVRPHVSNLFAIGGAVVGGPAAGAAVLLFSQIFRKPLSQLGESYYRVTGSWDDPDVQQLQGGEVAVTPLKNCEAYLDDALTNSLRQ